MRTITSSTAVSANDMRWAALDLVCSVRAVLGLRDRDIATLRGLLSLIGPDGWTGPMMVHASNRVLQERCDGADERSLRRRLAKLIDCGLIARRQSPNRKRYVLRDVEGQALVYYGFDLTPLRDALPQLQQMADDHAHEVARVKALKGLLRHRLYQIVEENLPTDADEQTIHQARLALRRNLSSDALELILRDLNVVNDVETKQVTDSDSQNDRHIENTKQDSLKEKLVQETQSEPRISLQACLIKLNQTLPLMQNQPQNWKGLCDNAWEIGKSLGLTPAQIIKSQGLLGKEGAAMCILGLVQAGHRIAKPAAYLNRVLSDAKRQDFDIMRMFRALTRPALISA